MRKAWKNISKKSAMYRLIILGSSALVFVVVLLVLHYPIGFDKVFELVCEAFGEAFADGIES